MQGHEKNKKVLYENEPFFHPSPVYIVYIGKIYITCMRRGDMKTHVCPNCDILIDDLTEDLRIATSFEKLYKKEDME